MRLVPGCGKLEGSDFLGMQRIGQHGFSCVLRHQFLSWAEPTVLCCLAAGLADQVLEGGPRAGLIEQVPKLCVGLVLPT